MEIRYLKIKPYSEALELMNQTHQYLVEHKNHPGIILVVQHPPTVTMGKRELLNDMILQPIELKGKNVDYHNTDRGGSVTVHEPGQIVIYPIIPLENYSLSVRSYVNILEEAMIQICAEYGVEAKRDPINSGVWVNKNKIGAIGIRISNKVTKHGLAFNVTNSLKTFTYIVPCGIRERGVTNLISEIKPRLEKSEDEILAEIELKLSEKLRNMLQNKASIKNIEETGSNTGYEI
jgi:lipoyl(octanoyl) transferase